MDDSLIQSGIDLLKHRGPDAQNFYHRDRCGLLHTRLSIIELSALGAQPYFYKNLVLVFNGELYNYREVRTQLIAEGYFFESNSDTEVLIKAFHRWREKCVDRFIGMFAFAVLETESRTLWLFRDRLGVKPLYYYTDGKTLYFASELSALKVFPVPRTLDADSVSEYFRFGFIGRDRSIYEGVKKLEPGHYLTIGANGVSSACYWHTENSAVVPPERKESEWIDELEELMTSSFRYRLVSDVPVGIFLSGGIDSSLLTAILQKDHGSINTFTIGFDEVDFDESAHAAKVATALKTNHTSRILGLEEAEMLFKDFYEIYDEPFADTSGIPTAFVTSLAKDAGMKVVLSADGGDELFGGYSHYLHAFSLYRKLNALRPVVRRGISKTIRTGFPVTMRSKFVQFNLEHKAYALEELLDAENPDEFFQAFIANQSRDEIGRMITNAPNPGKKTSSDTHPWQQMMDWDIHHFLPDDLLVKVDRATMFHSLECREPFLDHRLVEFSARLPLDLKIRNGQGKYILRQLLNRYLPESWFARKKQGFSIPIFAWFSKELDMLFSHYLSPENLLSIPFLNAGEIANEYRKYRIFKDQHMPYNIEKMWRILSFTMWWERHGKAGH